MKKILLTMAACLFSTQATCQSVLDGINSFEDVVASVGQIAERTSDGSLSTSDIIEIQSRSAWIGDLRTTFGVTGYDTEPEFRSMYWKKTSDAFKIARNPNTYAHSLSEFNEDPSFNTEAWNEYFVQNWEFNRDVWSSLVLEQGNLSEQDAAKNLAAMVYVANLGKITMQAENPDQLLQEWPTFIWPFCKAPSN